jgi:hypothetical protein
MRRLDDLYFQVEARNSMVSVTLGEVVTWKRILSFAGPCWRGSASEAVRASCRLNWERRRIRPLRPLSLPETHRVFSSSFCSMLETRRHSSPTFEAR